MTVRPETTDDYAGVKMVNDMAFGRPDEGNLVIRLRLNADFIPALSLVAETDDAVVGHILFFPVKVRGASKISTSLALAPMAVLPEFQRQGVGGKLITEGMKTAKALGFKSVIVLGHSNYYPKFGFTPASNWDIITDYDVPDDAFMAIALTEGGLKDASGTVVYPEEFGDVE